MSSPTNDNKDDTAVLDADIAAIDSTTVDEGDSDGGSVGILVPETKANDDGDDLLVDETNKSSADDLVEKERHSIKIDLMQNTIRKQLLIDQYRDLWGEDHGFQSSNSDQKDTVDDKTGNVDKEDEDTEDKDNMDADDVIRMKM
jgi:hypothetical protein